MSHDKKILTIIPARGGSKRFPKKNLAKLLGQSLIGYSINAAKNSQYIDRVIVSTDDEQIASLAKECGAEVPWPRPAELASDTSPVIKTIIHTVKKLDEENYHADYVLLLQSASPLTTSRQVDQACALALEKNADSVVAVSPVSHLNHPYNVREVLADGTIKFWQEELHYQDLGKPQPKFYKAANLWLSSFETIMNENRLEGKKNYPIIIDDFYSLDIDYKEDLEFIEIMLNYRNKKQ